VVPVALPADRRDAQRRRARGAGRRLRLRRRRHADRRRRRRRPDARPGRGAIGGGAAIRFDEPVPRWVRWTLPAFLWLFRRLRFTGGCFLFSTRAAFEAWAASTRASTPPRS
jgi:hypothetical protein